MNEIGNVLVKSFPRTPVLLFAMASISASCLANPAAEPEDRSAKESWLARHEKFVEIANTETDCQILFLGDSITDYWRTKGLPIWNEKYAPYNAVNFGISGDRTQHLLWRLHNGELGSLQPKVVVMMIGTNNVSVGSDGKTPRSTVAETVGGIRANVDYLRENLPDAKILLLGIFPRGTRDSRERSDVEEINRQIAELDDELHVFFRDIGREFLWSDGELPKNIMPDLLHPTPAGYAIWEAAMREPLAQLLN